MSRAIDDELLRANLPRLVTFVRVVERGSLTKAAQDLRVSRPAVSQSLRALEDALGVHLLDRSTRRVRPTQAGAELSEAASAFLGRARDAIERASEAGDRPTGTLRVASAGGLVAKALVIPALASLSREHALPVELFVSDRKVSMIEEGIDVAVRLGRPLEDGLVVRSFGAVPQILVASPALAAGVTSPRSLEALPWVLHSAQAPLLELSRGKERYALRRRARYRVDSSDVALELIASGLGAGMLPSLLAHHAIRAGALAQLLSDWTSYSVRVFAALPSRRNLPARTRMFLSALAGVVERVLPRERRGDPRTASVKRRNV